MKSVYNLSLFGNKKKKSYKGHDINNIIIIIQTRHTSPWLRFDFLFVDNGRFQHCNPVCDLPVKPLERRIVWNNNNYLNTDIHFKHIFTNLEENSTSFHFNVEQGKGLSKEK